MKKQRTLLEKINLFCKGLVMGSANKVPGVSGGMVAFVMGFYEELIFTFQRINSKSLKLLLTGRFRIFFRYINAEFLVLIMLGSMFSYFSISLLLDYFLRNYELFVWSWFFGLILGSIYYISKDFKDWSVKNIVALLVGATIGFAISFMTPAKENDNLWFVFLCGVIGVSGMTLPGLSGSFILILLGNYVLLLVDSVNVLGVVALQILSGNFDFISEPVKVRYLKIVGVFTAGSAFGLVSISHVLGYVLKKYHQIVVAVIIGFITGSLGTVWPWKQTIYKTSATNSYLLDQKGNRIVANYKRYIPDMFSLETWLAIVFIVLGFLLIILIDYYGKNKKT